ncbi:putative bifunctional diguanylate cyclase/phosphodiesterase [Modestobacter italicus]|uniref:putative bifunctional diguanylate cyclase/phosphodiesterase n=1 Tax=Modestobacter italicus (strain DSM 44449 / CECT 9708 / BC 501) TaxID=2732864 RepID=UPI001C94C21C|nr:GGDEF domain-containing phosphodiesterase [Modestobacter italicus]
MEQRRRASPGWLLAVPVLTGAAGGAVPLAADLLLLAASLGTAAVLWRSGSRRGARLGGWRLLAVAVLLGLLGDLGAGLWGAELFAGAGQAVGLPAVLIALVAVLRLLTPGQLRQGGARLLTETLLFFSASMVLAQVLVVGPALDGGPVGSSRLVLELACLATASVLSAGLVLIAASAGPRRVTGALMLLAVATWATAQGLTLAGPELHPAVLTAGVPAAQLASLLLLCLAAWRDPGAAVVAPPSRRSSRLGQAGQLVPHLVMVAAVLAYLVAPLLGAEPPLAAGVALVCCLTLTLLHRAVTARDEARVAARLRSSEAYFRSLVRSSSDAVVILGSDLRVTWAAPSLTPVRADAGPVLLGRSLVEVVHSEDAAEVRSWLSDDEGPVGLCSFRLPDGAGSWRVLEAGASDLRADADVRALVLHCRDVTARRHRERELSSLAFTDPLTGLPNRAAQLVALTELLGRLPSAGAPSVAAPGGVPEGGVPEGGVPEDGDAAGSAALLLIEVQGLREAHENAGRDVVDVALAEVARRLRAVVRAEDQVARIGAELFSVLAAGTVAEADRLAARCLSVIDAPIPTELGIVDLTAVAGLVPLAGGLTEREVVDRAELAVADARSAGAGSVRRHRDELTAARDRRELLRADLVGARERGELTLAWQPLIALDDHRVTGVEALLRWRHPVLGDVPPEEFLPVAERGGVVGHLQRWVLQEATAAAVTLPRREVPLKLGVNVSAQHLAGGTLVGDVTAALRASGMAPDQLVLEVSESALTGADVTDDVTALRLLGVHLALDDFGRASSSLPALGRLPLDIIKLDRTLLSRVDRDVHSRAVCEAVVALGRALQVDVVAEGVETTSQLSVLHGLGCGFAQGHLISRPVSLPRLVQLLEADGGRLVPGLSDQVGAA